MTIRTAVVLAAGEGTRLRPLTSNRPKPMLPAGNRPILEHVFDALIDAGIARLVVVVGYRADRVKGHFGPTYRDVPVSYVTQGTQLGSGHALLQAKPAVDGPFVVVNGDRVIDADSVAAVVDRFEADPTAPALSVLDHPAAGQYGAVETTDGELASLVEKPGGDDYGQINGGIYAFPPEIFAQIEATPRSSGELALTDSIARILEEDRVQAVQTDGLWEDATYPWDLLAVARSVLAAGRVDASERDPGVWVDETAVVDDEATLRAPVAVAPDAAIGPGAVVGPDVAVGANVTVEANATVQHSVLDADTRVGAGSTTRQLVTGQDATLGVATTVPGGPADVQIGTTVFESQPLGAVLADRVTTRGATSFEPGTLVGPDATVDTGAHVRGRVAEGAEVVR